MPADPEAHAEHRAWPFQEARKLVERLRRGAAGGRTSPAKEHVVFETGYGPSGPPHIGTVGEVARTGMVRHAFAQLSDTPSRLYVFSDDMDGLRKVPDGVPDPQVLREHLGKPLTSIPDPWGTHDSFAHHNNAMLREYLDRFGFDYEFVSSTEQYTGGRFDDVLLRVLERYDKVIEVILPTLGEERRATYSPFLPVSPRSGRVLQARVVERDAAAGTIVYEEEDGSRERVPVTGGRCKLQWKADWAMRWTALGVDYEMYGKDIADSVDLSSRVCRILGSAPPEGFAYELFLDEHGRKISKSLGNGLTIDEWLRYGTEESLLLYMFQSPRKAKRMYFDVIPRHVDDYFAHLGRYREQPPAERPDNPLWHVHAGEVPEDEGAGTPLSFSLLLNLTSVCNTDQPDVLWGFISRYAPGVSAETHPALDRLVAHAIAYYQDFVRPNKKYRTPTPAEREALEQLAGALEALPDGAAAEEIQGKLYELGKSRGYTNLREWFGLLYEVLLGQSAGPRMGSFIAVFGIPETVALIRRVLAGERP